jgi:hypothetical protein
MAAFLFVCCTQSDFEKFILSLLKEYVRGNIAQQTSQYVSGEKDIHYIEKEICLLPFYGLLLGRWHLAWGRRRGYANISS